MVLQIISAKKTILAKLLHLCLLYTSSAIAGVSDKDPDKEYLLAAYNEVSKNFHKSPAYQRLPNTPEDAIVRNATTKIPG